MTAARVLDLSIVVPYRPHPDRDLLFAWGQERLLHTCGDAELIVCSDDGQPGDQFNRARACNTGIMRAHRRYVLVGDADVVYDRAPALAAVELMEQGAPWVVGYTHKWHLSAESTRLLVDGSPLLVMTPYVMDFLTVDPLYPKSRTATGGTSSFVVLRRDVFPDLRFDERFVGWGYEDQAFAAALTTMLGPCERVEGSCLHLWHRYVGNDPNPHRQAGLDLWGRYQAADGDRDAMSKLLAEAP